MSWFKQHPGWIFPYRAPAAQGLVENGIVTLGGVYRALGKGLDSLGTYLQGPGGKIKDTIQPNLAWAPTAVDPSSPPTQGQKIPNPAPSGFSSSIKEFVLPRKGANVFIAPGANVMGDVKIGANSSIWYNAVLRGDVNGIEIGDNTNIQDNAIIHVAKHSIHGQPRSTKIGNNVTVGHGATIHAATIGDNSLVGMGAIVLDGAQVGNHAVVAAGAVVTPGTNVPSGEVWAGNPAKFLRKLSPEEVDFIHQSAHDYVDLAQTHKFENSKTFEELVTEERIIAFKEYLYTGMQPTEARLWEYDEQTALAIKMRQ